MASETDASPGGRPRRILLAEDDPDLRTLLGRFLTAEGHEVHRVADGQEAFDRVLADGDWDLLLTDLQMPGMDGIELTRRIRKRERTAALGALPLPVVAVTAHALDRFRELAREAGMDGFLTKPIRRGDLVAVLAPWLDDGRSRLLVVEDDVDGRRLLARRLTRSGEWRGVFAGDAEAALDLARRRPFEAALVDLELPGRDGLAFAEALRLLPGGDRTALVALTGHPSDHPKSVAAGRGPFRAVLAKPAGGPVLFSALAPTTAAGGPESQEVGRRGELGVRGDASAARTDRQEGAAVWEVAVDPDLLDLIPGFLAHRREDLDRLRALVSSDAGALASPAGLDELGRLAHRFKGAAASYGFEELALMAGELLEALRRPELSAARRALDTLERYLDGVVVVSAGPPDPSVPVPFPSS